MCQSLQRIFLGNVLFSGNFKLRSCESSVKNKELPYTLYPDSPVIYTLPHLFYSLNQVFGEQSENKLEIYMETFSINT